MEKASDIFHRAFNAFRDNPVRFLTFIILCIGVYFIYTQTEYIVSLLPDPHYENAQFQASLKRDSQINASLDDAREFYNAQGIVIGQFHNGQYDLTNLPFTKITITYYSGQTNLTTEEIYTTRPLSSMNQIMRAMWEDKENPQCISRKVSELKDAGYRQRMEATGLKFITLCPITNIRNYPIGYLSTGFPYEPTEDEKDILLDYQFSLSRRVAGYLQTGVVNEN